MVLIGMDKITEEESYTMADEYRMALAELLRKAEMEGDLDFLREGVRVMGQALMELEVAQHIGAERHERTPERTGQRNGYRDRSWDTRVGSIELKVPRVRDGGFYPVMLEPRKRAERALVAVVQEAYVQGVSTRRVDDLVRALGMNGISKSQVSRLCQELDGEVERFRSRRLDGPYPYVWLDATYLKVRENSRVVSMAVVIAIGVRATGEREVLGLDVGPSEDGAFWTGFLRGLVARRLSGVELVVSDAHEGLKGAISAVLVGLPGRGAESTSCATPSPWCPRPHPRWWTRRGFAVAGYGHYQDGVRAARCGQCERAVEAGGRGLRGPLPASVPPARRCRGRRPRLPRLPQGALETDLEQQPPGEAEPGDRAEDGRGGHLPQPGGRHPVGGICALRAARRVAGEPALPECRVAGEDLRGEGAGDAAGPAGSRLGEAARGDVDSS